MIMGTQDPFVPWAGGEVHYGELLFGQVLSVPETIRCWVTDNYCSFTPTFTWEPNTDPQDGTRVLQKAYSLCSQGTEVILEAIIGGGHTWPGGYQYLLGGGNGKISKDINANEVIWNFFKKHVIE
jgi:polyhydroxybutyrate depolymerase